mgnify:CR=1 FL=1
MKILKHSPMQVWNMENMIRYGFDYAVNDVALAKQTISDYKPSEFPKRPRKRTR